MKSFWLNTIVLFTETLCLSWVSSYVPHMPVRDYPLGFDRKLIKIAGQHLVDSLLYIINDSLWYH